MFRRIQQINVSASTTGGYFVFHVVRVSTSRLQIHQLQLRIHLHLWQVKLTSEYLLFLHYIQRHDPYHSLQFHCHHKLMPSRPLFMKFRIVCAIRCQFATHLVNFNFEFFESTVAAVTINEHVNFLKDKYSKRCTLC